MNFKKIGWLVFFGILSINFSFASDWNLPGVEIISRAERGADETIRFRSTPRPTNSTNGAKTEAQIKSENISKIRNAWMAKNFPLEWKYEGSNTMFGNHYLIYPEYFNHHKNKIVIHHTAMDYNPNRTSNDVKNHLQKIYKYHTIDRNFGDIGYNFLIDQLGNIYEGRAGGEGAVGMHASSNNVSSIGIALLGNFETDKPTEAQLSALVNLTTALARFYNIDPYGTTQTFTLNTIQEPYVTAKENFTIMGHRDVKATACPGKNLDAFLPKIREEVAFRLSNGIIGDVPLPSNWFANSSSKATTVSLNKTISTTPQQSKTNNIATETNNSSFSARFASLQKESPNIFNEAAKDAKKHYNGTLTHSSNSISKITKKYSIDEVSQMLKQDISVLLYELTTKYDSFEIKCRGGCIFNIDGTNYYRSGANLTLLSNRIQISSNYNLSASTVSVRSYNSGDVVEIANYQRKSYAGIPWNIFRGELKFEKGTYPLKNGEQKSDFIVVNTLPFSEYMKGIVETNDTETLEKNKVMAMISKNYALFYMNKGNIHPSISADASYTAIDDPNFFQKYVGAGLEKTLTKRYQALNLTKNQIVMYDNYLPILPYFSCSPGFTLSAEEKRGWNDTPYLKSTYDFDTCDDFAGHGVGLSGKGAEQLAKLGMTYNQILKYYYDGIIIANLE